MARTHRRLERIVKGFANHRRLAMLETLEARPGLTVEELAGAHRVEHTLSPRGVAVLGFCRSLA